MQLRVLVTSANSSLNWDLRCKVREALIDFMQRDYPQHLPLMRAELAEIKAAIATAPPDGLQGSRPDTIGPSLQG